MKGPELTPDQAAEAARFHAFIESFVRERDDAGRGAAQSMAVFIDGLSLLTARMMAAATVHGLNGFHAVALGAAISGFTAGRAYEKFERDREQLEAMTQ